MRIKRIFKFTLSITHKQIVELPIGSTILTVQTQDMKPQIWAVVDTYEKLTEKRTIILLTTGEPIDDSTFLTLHYIGTFQLHNGTFVGHVFEEKEE